MNANVKRIRIARIAALALARSSPWHFRRRGRREPARLERFRH
jgi:hypothetical protein